MPCVERPSDWSAKDWSRMSCKAGWTCQSRSTRHSSLRAGRLEPRDLLSLGAPRDRPTYWSALKMLQNWKKLGREAVDTEQIAMGSMYVDSEYTTIMYIAGRLTFQPPLPVSKHQSIYHMKHTKLCSPSVAWVQLALGNTFPLLSTHKLPFQSYQQGPVLDLSGSQCNTDQN